MRTDEAAERLGISIPSVVRYARILRIKTKLKKRYGTHCYYDFSQADLDAIKRERRKRQVAQSERNAKRMKRLAKDPTITRIRIAARDPEEFERTRKKAVKAAAERRRQIREWLWRHDSV